MQKNILFVGVLAGLLAFGLLAAGCDNGGGGGETELLEVTHVTGFQGTLSDGSLIEIEVPNTDDGNQSFTVYISGAKNGTGTLTLANGSIIAIVNCTNGANYK
jgi:hypothetical protein